MLAIEVESPSDPLLDDQVKRELYLSHGVPEYWIANADGRVRSRWRSLDDSGEVVSNRIDWQPARIALPLVVDPSALFDDALS